MARIAIVGRDVVVNMGVRLRTSRAGVVLYDEAVAAADRALESVVASLDATGERTATFDPVPAP